jgi:hypothetical protein
MSVDTMWKRMWICSTKRLLMVSVLWLLELYLSLLLLCVFSEAIALFKYPFSYYNTAHSLTTNKASIVPNSNTTSAPNCNTILAPNSNSTTLHLFELNCVLAIKCAAKGV